MSETDKRLTRRRFYKAEQEASFVEAQTTETAQTQSPSYRLAFRDTDFPAARRFAAGAVSSSS